MKAPFPWFGGKSLAAHHVWTAMGDVEHYVEPFAGSLAVLLVRPHAPRVETVNDLDRYICNFWRALQAAPDEVAYWADQPVNESDLTARHIWLVNSGAERIARLEGDPDYYDAKVAGWWVWGLCCWIGGGWCAGGGPWGSENRQLVHLGNPGQGVNRQLVHLGNPGQGVNRQLVHLGDAGRGVKRKRVHLGDQSDGLYTYLSELAARLRYVRVCCGDWARVVTRGALSHGSTVGVFLDPPYDMALRDSTIYRQDAEGLSGQVREWCLENGDNPRYRIVLAGYEGEHDMPWRSVAWKARRAMGRADSPDNGNRHKERLWLSPHCLDPLPLFDLDAG